MIIRFCLCSLPAFIRKSLFVCSIPPFRPLCLSSLSSSLLLSVYFLSSHFLSTHSPSLSVPPSGASIILFSLSLWLEAAALSSHHLLCHPHSPDMRDFSLRVQTTDGRLVSTPFAWWCWRPYKKKATFPRWERCYLDGKPLTAADNQSCQSQQEKTTSITMFNRMMIFSLSVNSMFERVSKTDPPYLCIA